MILNNECQIVATPGHTSGHISLYFPNLDCVITGDAAVQENRELVIANPNFCLDIEKAKQSLNRIKSFKAAQYYCYHGGKLINENRSFLNRKDRFLVHIFCDFNQISNIIFR